MAIGGRRVHGAVQPRLDQKRAAHGDRLQRSARASEKGLRRGRGPGEIGYPACQRSLEPAPLVHLHAAVHGDAGRCHMLQLRDDRPARAAHHHASAQRHRPCAGRGRWRQRRIPRAGRLEILETGPFGLKRAIDACGGHVRQIERAHQCRRVNAGDLRPGARVPARVERQLSARSDAAPRCLDAQRGHIGAAFGAGIGGNGVELDILDRPELQRRSGHVRIDRGRGCRASRRGVDRRRGRPPDPATPRSDAARVASMSALSVTASSGASNCRTDPPSSARDPAASSRTPLKVTSSLPRSNVPAR